MELANVPARLTALLAGLVALWTLLRRLRGQGSGGGGGSPFPKGPAEGAGEGAAAQTQSAEEAEGAAPEAAEQPAAYEPDAAKPEKVEEAMEAAPESPAATAAAPPSSPKPEAEALQVAEDPQLAKQAEALAALHGRTRESVDVSSCVRTSFVPDLSPKSAEAPQLLLSRTQLLAVVGAVELCGLLCLGLALALGAGASVGLVVMLVLVAAAAFALPSLCDSGHAPSSQPAEALHACAAGRREAAAAVWGHAVAWAAAAPDGCRRGIAWRNGLAFLLQAEESSEQSPTRTTAFVLETGPLVVHHYVVRQGATSSAAPEAAWGLRAFLAEAVPGESAIADDVPSGASFGPSSVAPRRYRKAKAIMSQRDGMRLHEAVILDLKEGEEGMAQEPSVFVSPGHRTGKPWLGIGGSFTEASAVVFDAMTPEHQEEVLRAYFSPTGAAFSIGRMSMGSCDFGLGNWACGDLKAEDYEMKDFSIRHYHEKILPMYRRAAEIAGKPIGMLASPWSPPPWMKTKFQWNGDAHLRKECGQVWADHFVRFVKEMSKAGVRIMAVTVQNEPEAAQRWEACIYTGTEERDFVRDHLGPTLCAAGLSSVKVLIWDHNRDGMLERAQIAYADPEASKYIWGCAYHWYGDARFESWPERTEVYCSDRQREWATMYEVRSRLGLDNVRRVAELAPDKHILFTEGCQELSGLPLEVVMYEWKFAERYAMNIIADINNGVEGWIDWNLFLNERGGPNHVENNCLAPIIYNTQEKKVIYTPPFFALSHFSRFIHPGARRVVCSTSRDVLEVTAFVNPDESLAVVVLNQSIGDVFFKLKVGSVSGDDPIVASWMSVPPQSLTTFVIE